MTSENPAWLQEEDNPFQDDAVTAAQTAPPSTTVPPSDSGAPPNWAQTSQDPGFNSIPEPMANAAVKAAAPHVQDAAQAAARDAANEEAVRVKKKCNEMPRLWLAMRVANFLITLLLGFAAWEKAIDNDNTSFSIVIIAFYIVCFAMILCCFEAFSAIKCIAGPLARFFGFMYTIPGRLFFLVMTGFLCISLETTTGYAIAGVVFALSLYNVFVMNYYPDWTKQLYQEHNENFESAV